MSREQRISPETGELIQQERERQETQETTIDNEGMTQEALDFIASFESVPGELGSMADRYEGEVTRDEQQEASAIVEEARTRTNEYLSNLEPVEQPAPEPARTEQILQPEPPPTPVDVAARLRSLGESMPAKDFLEKYPKTAETRLKAMEVRQQREKIADTEQKLKGFGGVGAIKRFTGKGREEMAKLEDELEAAEAEYERTKYELAGDSAKHTIKERMRLVDDRFAAFESDKPWAAKVKEGYKWLGDQNLDKVFKPTSKLGKMAGKAASLRTVVGLGLTAGGVAAGGLAAGAAAITARRVMSGMGAGFGTYDLLRSREAIAETSEWDPEDMDVFELVERMEQMEARALVDGQELKGNAEFRKLRAELNKRNAERQARALLEQMDENIDDRLEELKVSQKTHKALAGAVGLLAGNSHAVLSGLKDAREYLSETFTSVVETIGQEIEETKAVIDEAMKEPEVAKVVEEPTPAPEKPVEAPKPVEKPPPAPKPVEKISEAPEPPKAEGGPESDDATLPDETPKPPAPSVDRIGLMASEEPPVSHKTVTPEAPSASSAAEELNADVDETIRESFADRRAELAAEGVESQLEEYLADEDLKNLTAVFDTPEERAQLLKALEKADISGGLDFKKLDFENMNMKWGYLGNQTTGYAISEDKIYRFAGINTTSKEKAILSALQHLEHRELIERATEIGEVEMKGVPRMQTEDKIFGEYVKAFAEAKGLKGDIEVSMSYEEAGPNTLQGFKLLQQDWMQIGNGHNYTMTVTDSRGYEFKMQYLGFGNEDQKAVEWMKDHMEEHLKNPESIKSHKH